jgi:glycosyltransferase involved in cell wall biosynthesis
MEGVSVIICSHNGASRLPTTLAHLMAQEPPQTPWEVVLVDNASTDNSVEVARSCWQEGPAPLRVVAEPRLGVRFARECGLAEANYAFLGFVDDDNWVATDWVSTAYSIMSSDARLGALGSIRIPVCEESLPVWFEKVHPAYAILTDCEFEKIQEPLMYLLTSGLCIRRAAWENLIHTGFQLQLIGRRGKELSGGEDIELTMSLRLSGWELRIDPRLRLQHFMPTHRLHWPYARRLLRYQSASDVLLDAYSDRSVSMPPGFRRWLSERWWYQLGKTGLKMARHPGAAVAALCGDGEGRSQVIEVEERFGRAAALIRLKGKYGALRREVREAPWRAPHLP